VEYQTVWYVCVYIYVYEYMCTCLHFYVLSYFMVHELLVRFKTLLTKTVLCLQYSYISNFTCRCLLKSVIVISCFIKG